MTTKLTHAYRRMVERVKNRFDEMRQAEQEVLPELQHSVEHAAEKAVELGELTREEAQLIGGYLRRDLEDAGHYLAETGHDFSTWLRFDLTLAEERLLEWFRGAADQTRLQLLALEATASEPSDYRSGEITGPGTLQCDQCGEQLAFHGVAPIPACPRCGATHFSRAAKSH